MIISASRRTDLPAYYGDWLRGRLRAGEVVAVNPFNPRQQRRVSLRPDDVDALVFWTRDPGRLARLCDDLESAGHRRWVAHVTITGLDRRLEPRGLSVDAAAAGMRELSRRAGDPRRVIWRYDPIVLGPRDGPDEHLERFGRMAALLEGATRRVVVSFLDVYRKTGRRLAAAGYPYDAGTGADTSACRRELIGRLVTRARRHGMELEVCAEPESYAAQGAPATRCVDPELLAALFPGREFPAGRHKGQRPDCRCAPSVDIGSPDTCVRGCVYCYATRSDEAAARAARRHDRRAESLLPLAPGAPGAEICSHDEPETADEPLPDRGDESLPRV